MLYWLSFFKENFGLLNLFRYLTFRTGAALLTAFILTLIFMPKLIKWLKSKQAEQPIRSCGPETHLAKKGTPTLGGLMILITGTIATLLWANLMNSIYLGIIVCFFGNGIDGFRG